VEPETEAEKRRGHGFQGLAVGLLRQKNIGTARKISQPKGQQNKNHRNTGKEIPSWTPKLVRYFFSCRQLYPCGPWQLKTIPNLMTESCCVAIFFNERGGFGVT